MNTQPDDQFDVPPLPEDPFNTSDINDMNSGNASGGGTPTWVWIIAIIVGLLCICGVIFGGIAYFVTQNADEFIDGITGTLEAESVSVTVEVPEIDIDIPTLDPNLIPTLELPTLAPLGESTPDLLPTLEPVAEAAEEVLSENPAPVPSSKTNYYETFDEIGDWGVGILETDEGNLEVSADIKDGVLSFEAFIPEGFYWSTAGQNLGTGTYELEATAVSGPVDNGFGMLFFADNDADDFYLFEISSDGFVWIGFCDNGCEELEMLVGDGWFESDAVNQGIGAKNTLRVDVNDGTMTFYVNGTLVGEAYDTTRIGGDVGVAIESFSSGNVLIEFDNFRYSK